MVCCFSTLVCTVEIKYPFLTHVSMMAPFEISHSELDYLEWLFLKYSLKHCIMKKYLSKQVISPIKEVRLSLNF